MKRRTKYIFLCGMLVLVFYGVYVEIMGPYQLRWLGSPSADLWMARGYRCPRDVNRWMIAYGP